MGVSAFRNAPPSRRRPGVVDQRIGVGSAGTRGFLWLLWLVCRVLKAGAGRWAGAALPRSRAQPCRLWASSRVVAPHPSKTLAPSVVAGNAIRQAQLQALVFRQGCCILGVQFGLRGPAATRRHGCNGQSCCARVHAACGMRQWVLLVQHSCLFFLNCVARMWLGMGGCAVVGGPSS